MHAVVLVLAQRRVPGLCDVSISVVFHKRYLLYITGISALIAINLSFYVASLSLFTCKCMAPAPLLKCGPVYLSLIVVRMRTHFSFCFQQEHTGFDETSSFIDVGAGLGKPNFHVAQDPGVEISYGLELEVVRWELSIANHRM